MHSTLALGNRNSPAVADEEAALVLAAQEDRLAFGPLYERYAHRVYAYLRARTDSADDAADLTQQVFLRALDALPRYRRTKAPFAAWLFRIARNLAINFQKRHRPTVAWDSVPEALQPATTDDMTRRVEHAERLSRLFGQLDPEIREMVVLRFGAQLTHSEIGTVLGKSEAATKMRLNRALRTLKEHYDDEPE
jgi:RNA polymerase sigma-70 factor, ECF subfamily